MVYVCMYLYMYMYIYRIYIYVYVYIPFRSPFIFDSYYVNVSLVSHYIRISSHLPATSTVALKAFQRETLEAAVTVSGEASVVNMYHIYICAYIL